MINVSETAAAKITELLIEEQKTGGGLRVFVQGGGCSGFQYGLMIDENGQGAGDQVFECHGVKLFVDPISIRESRRGALQLAGRRHGGALYGPAPAASGATGCRPRLSPRRSASVAIEGGNT